MNPGITAIIADLHLTSPGADKTRQRRIAAWLRRLRPGRIILLGDTLELYLKTAFLADDTWRCLQRLAAGGSRIILIPGNDPHDSARRLKKFARHLGPIELSGPILELGAWKLHHGSGYDRRARIWSAVLRPLELLIPRTRAELMQRHLPSALARTPNSPDKAHRSIAAIRRRASADARKTGKNIIHSHTHSPQLSSVGGRLICDLGAAGMPGGATAGLLIGGRLYLKDIPSRPRACANCQRPPTSETYHDARARLPICAKCLPISHTDRRPAKEAALARAHGVAGVSHPLARDAGQALPEHDGRRILRQGMAIGPTTRMKRGCKPSLRSAGSAPAGLAGKGTSDELEKVGRRNCGRDRAFGCDSGFRVVRGRHASGRGSSSDQDSGRT